MRFLTEDQIHLQENLNGIRILYNISAEELGNEIGMSRQSINNLENGKTQISKTIYLAIIKVLPKLMKKHEEDRKKFEEKIISAQDYLYDKYIDSITDCDWVKKMLKGEAK